MHHKTPGVLDNMIFFKKIDLIVWIGVLIKLSISNKSMLDFTIKWILSGKREVEFGIVKGTPWQRDFPGKLAIIAHWFFKNG